jgi:Protein of unknown function (DUF2848)
VLPGVKGVAVSEQNELLLRYESTGKISARRTSIDQLVIAGWTGRDPVAVEKHIRELEEIGVPRPKRTPIFYRIGASLLTTTEEIQVAGGDSSGEVEFVLFSLADGLWVGVGSDHTDRKVEVVGVTLAKQLCPKPVSAAVWRYADVRPHWDRLILRSHACTGEKKRLYQEGPVTAMRHPDDLMRLYSSGGATLPEGYAMFCGTLAVKGAIEAAEVFAIELEDPILGRKLTHVYKVVQLPVEG